MPEPNHSLVAAITAGCLAAGGWIVRVLTSKASREELTETVNSVRQEIKDGHNQIRDEQRELRDDIRALHTRIDDLQK